ncbi:helix-turn-helix transcriptional regulator [Catenovulum sp. SX2]|uniref:AraC family transcriptional regulator n=1 Tax=Catenovulum sp. SX2 TaxID=3398614 RepID=UPI003F877ABE
MQSLIQSINAHTQQYASLPYAAYTSVQTQNLRNVPIVNPCFIAVLSGEKALTIQDTFNCNAGEFVVLADNNNVHMRNLPTEVDYFALFIEFEADDFVGLDLSPTTKTPNNKYIHGLINQQLKTCLQQFVEWTAIVPENLWPQRRKELLQILIYLGYPQVIGCLSAQSTISRCNAVLRQHPYSITSSAFVAEQLNMSESSLRRKLSAEQSSFQQLKDQIRLGTALHLLQTTQHSITYVAEQSGYQSPSKFASRFKQRFGLTPTQLRKTKETNKAVKID